MVSWLENRDGWLVGWLFRNGSNSYLEIEMVSGNRGLFISGWLVKLMGNRVLFISGWLVKLMVLID